MVPVPGEREAFIDEMATLLGVPVPILDDLASRHTTIYPMASRCGVFAKTDLQNLLSRQVPQEDIAASVFHAVVLQTLATLARGRDVLPTILFSGGPFTFMPSLKDSVSQVLNLDKADVVAAESPELLPALGAALAPSSSRRSTDDPGTDRYPLGEEDPLPGRDNRHEALFESADDYQGWLNRQQGHRIEKVEVDACRDEDYFLGIDSGSTTTKVRP